MKQTNASLRWVLALVLLTIGGSWGATNTWAQKVKAHGVVKDATGEPLIGVAIKVLEEEGKGTVTKFDGEFNIEVERNATLRFSYVGFTPQDISLKDATFPLNVVLKEDQETLGELVVIGYGAVEKKDLTGSITAIGSDDFKKGLISTPDQLISGKVAGVQIVSGGGSPGAGSKIRIRGGASLNASNDPLIVIDGVPLEGSTLPGAPSPLSSINPADIESMNILKDASATAIYGSRASNGVIIITTKRGKLGQPLQIHASTRFSVSTPKKYVDVLTGNEVRQLVQQYGTESHKEGVGTESTDWQRAIFQNAFGTDNNVSISGATSWLPYRVSVGYYNENGILRTDHMQRLTGDLSLNPRFFDGDLAVDLNVKASRTNNRYADRGAIGAALSMDPTHPVTSDDPFYAPFGGYWFYHSINDAGLVIPTSLATINPLALLNDRENEGVANRIISNINIGYQMPFIEGLRANLNIAYDYGASGGNNYVPVHSIVAYTNQKVGKGGVNNIYQQEKVNKLLDFYLNYKTEVESIQSSFDVMAGYSYQDWKTTVHNFSEMTAGGIEYNLPAFPLDYPQNTLVSFYGRLNYSLIGRYLLTATVRADGSSRFAPENRWGIFPSFAFAWRAKDEAFLQDVDVLSDLKLRLGYGVTGQQDGIANYSYQGVYALSGNQSKYLFGNTWYNMYKPLAYDADIKWEQTATSNIGVDFAFLDHRITGSLDLYHKETKDLLNETPIPAGANFSNRLLTNVGEITNDGVELTLAFVPIETTDWRWSIDFNTTWNRTRIKRLNQANDPTFQGVPTGGIQGGTGNQVQIHTEGFAPNSFFMYKQVYDTNGKPIEGLFADLDGNGVINNYDKYHVGKPEPDLFMGLSTQVSYKGLSLSTAFRANIGNYVYDNVSAEHGVRNAALSTLGWVSNATRDYYNTGFVNNSYLSDHYIYDASFLKMDNLSVGYNFGRVFNDVVAINLSATVQNVFTLTKYKGLDPEIGNGVDYNFYPIPRTYSLSLGLTF